jgi:choline dehydrogenase
MKEHGRWESVARGRTLGGSGAVNAQMWVLGDPKDWDTIGQEQWAWRRIGPLFEWLNSKFDTRLVSKSNKTLAAMMKACKTFQVVEDHQQAILEGKVASPLSYCRQNNSASERQNPFSVLVEPLIAGGQVTVVDAATVERVVLNAKHEATGVVFSVPGSGARYVAARHEVVLCAGTFNSAQLLMLSGVGPREELARHAIPCLLDLPVGQGLVDHVYARTSAFLKDPADRTDGSFLDCTGFYKSKWSQQNEPERGRDMQLVMYAAPPRIASLNTAVSELIGKVFALGSRSTLRGKVFHFLHRIVVAAFVGTGILEKKLIRAAAMGTPLNHPRSRGSLTLRSADPHVAPVIDLGLLSAPEDRQRLVEAVRLMLDAWRAEPLASLVETLDPGTQKLLNATDDEILRYVLATGSHAWHPCSTAAIGRVVNASLRVKGASRLRVADCSSLPNVPSGNTMCAAFLVGANAAELIGAEWDPKAHS